MSALLQLQEHGQSYWLDNLTRGMLVDGELARRVETEGLRGVTSNPAIFHNAITGSAQYDEDIARFTDAGLGVDNVYDRLTVADVQGACDVLRGVWESSGGVDGYVSLEVSPHLANDTEGTVRGRAASTMRWPAATSSSRSPGRRPESRLSGKRCSKA